MKKLTLAAVVLTRVLIGGMVPSPEAGEFTGKVIGPLKENDGYYAILTGGEFKLNWDKSRIYAESLTIRRNGRVYRGFLYTPNTKTENDFVVNGLKPNEHWMGLYQGPGPKTPDANWLLLNNRQLTYRNWGGGEPDDQKNGVVTRCRILSYFTGVNFQSDGNEVQFGVQTNTSKETGCENFGMLRADGKFKDKEGRSNGNGFLVEFRAL